MYAAAAAVAAAAAGSGCIAFLDFEKAYDRIDRQWLMACLRALGFGAGAQRWVALLLEGSVAEARFGDTYSRHFAVLSGAAQGSPLSPLLFVAAVQPLAARLRRLQATGRIDAISLPGGALAPPSHQHADDTTIHTATAAGIAGAISLAVQPFCAASASHLNTQKCTGLTLGSHPPIQGTHAASGITFTAPGTVIRHLGILLTTGSRAAAADEAWQRRVSAVAASIRHWSHVDLTLLGRAHVAKQVLGNQLPFLATFVEPPPQRLRTLQRLIDGFTMRGPLAGGADTAVPLRARVGRF